MKTIALIAMVAIVLEALVEYFKTIIRMVEEADYKTAITQAITIALGIFLAFGFHLELFNMGMSEIYEGLQINSILDKVLTGILFSRGSNYFSDLVSKLQHKGDGTEQLLALYHDGTEIIDDVYEFDDDYDDVIEGEGDEDGTADESET